jgi:lipopolysaccharide/colanic/teichoic acid biosynthesis glycosyltransferase
MMTWKKWFDCIAVSIGLLLLSGLLVAIALAIWLLDGRPILFRQQRLGQGKRPFYVYKFRTMHNNHISRFGHVLRQTGLDELAQIFNILRGEMSVVGPRPLTLTDVARLGWDDDFHASRWHLKPGITGLAQLYGGRGAKVSWLMDGVYQQRMSLWMDVRIVLLSFAVNLFGKARVRRILFRPRS